MGEVHGVAVHDESKKVPDDREAVISILPGRRPQALRHLVGAVKTRIRVALSGETGEAAGAGRQDGYEQHAAIPGAFGIGPSRSRGETPAEGRSSGPHFFLRHIFSFLHTTYYVLRVHQHTTDVSSQTTYVGIMLVHT